MTGLHYTLTSQTPYSTFKEHNSYLLGQAANSVFFKNAFYFSINPSVIFSTY